MHRTRFDHFTFEFDLNGRHYRTDPVDLTAIEIQDTTARKSDTQKSDTPRYALRKGLGVWRLIFDFQSADLKHERGLFYISWLLRHPPDRPIHALDLMAKSPEIYRQQLALTELANPETGRTETVQSHARLQERSLSLDDAQSLRALLRKQRELEAILDDPAESEPVKAEALRDLEAITEFQQRHARRTRTAAQLAAEAVRKSIARLHRHLLQAAAPDPQWGKVLAAFANHLYQYLIIPSRRYSGHGNRFARSGLAGCFTYEPPPDTHWSEL